MGIGYGLRALIWYMQGKKSFGHAGYTKAAAKFVASDLDTDLSGRHFVITGANSGLGKATALALAEKKGTTVHLVCRNKERAEAAKEEIVQKSGNHSVHVHLVDLSSLDDIRQFAKDYTAAGHGCDVLVNNAGVMQNERLQTKEGYDYNTSTNVVGTFLITELMLPLLKESKVGGRVVTVSSGGMLTEKLEVDDLHFSKWKKYDGTRAYAQNKRAQVLLTHHWAELYKDSGVKFFSMHPGWARTPAVQTSMPGFYDRLKDMMRTTEQGADTIIWLAACDKVVKDEASNGQFFFDRSIASEHLPMCNTVSPPAHVKKLYDECRRMAGLE